MIDRASIKDRVKEICELRNSKTIYEFAMNYKYYLDDEDRNMIIDTICNKTNGSTYVYRLALERRFYNENNKDIFVDAICRIKFGGSIVNFARDVRYLNNDDYNKLAMAAVDTKNSYCVKRFFESIGISNRNIKGKVIIDDKIIKKYLELIIEDNVVIDVWAYGCKYVNILMSDSVLFDAYFKVILESNEERYIMEFVDVVLNVDSSYINKFVDAISNIKEGNIISSFVSHFGSMIDTVTIQKLTDRFLEQGVVKDDEMNFNFMNDVSGKIDDTKKQEFENLVIESNNERYIYSYAIKNKDLDVSVINKLAEAMCNTSDIKYIKLFLSNVSGIDDKLKNELARIYCKNAKGNVYEINNFMKMNIDFFDNITINEFVEAVCSSESIEVDYIYDFTERMFRYLDQPMINKLAFRLADGGSIEQINKFMEKFIDYLDNDVINKFIDSICKCKNSENIYCYTKKFFEYFDNITIDKIVDSACLNATADFAYKFTKDFINYLDNGSINKIVDVICKSKKTEDIYIYTKDFIEHLDNEAINKIVNIVCLNAESDYIYKFTKNFIKHLDISNIQKLKDSICQTKSVSYIYDFMHIDGLNDTVKEEIKIFIKEKICNSKFVSELFEDGINKNILFEDLIVAVLKTGNAKYIYDFACGFENLSDKYIKKLGKGLDGTKEAEYIYKFAIKFIDIFGIFGVEYFTSCIIKTDNVKYILDFFEYFSEKINYVDFYIFSMKLVHTGDYDSFLEFVTRFSAYLDVNNNMSLLVNEICKMCDGSYIYKMATELKNLTNEQRKMLTNAMCKVSDAEYIYEYAKNVSGLDSDNLKSLSEAMIRTNHVGYIYMFAKNVPNLNDFLKEKLIDFCIMDVYAFDNYLLGKRGNKSFSSPINLESLLMTDLEEKEKMINSFSKNIISYEKVIKEDREKFLPYVNRTLDRYQKIVMARQVMDEAFNNGNNQRGKK